LHQSYQDYTCSAEEDALAGGQMACDVDPEMEMRASTQAGWYGAPPKLFCAPKSKVPKAPRWDYTEPWCAPEGAYGHVEPFADDVDLQEYFEYVNAGGSCKDYAGIKTGGWKFTGDGCEDGACPGHTDNTRVRPGSRSLLQSSLVKEASMSELEGQLNMESELALESNTMIATFVFSSFSSCLRHIPLELH